MTDKNLTVTQLARTIGMKTSTLHNYCNGILPRNVEGLHRLSEYLKCSIDDILFRDLETKKSGSAQAQNMRNIEGKYEVIIRLIDTDIPGNRNT